MRAGEALAVLWLAVAPVIFLLEARAPLGEAWTSPFGGLSGAARWIPAALALPGAGGGAAEAAGFAGVLAAAAMAAAAGAGLGLALFRWLGARGLACAAPLAAPAGLALLAASAHAIGLCGVSRTGVGWAALAASALAGWRARGALARAAPRPSVLGAAGVGLALAALAVPAAAPVRHADALIYHVPLPRDWAATGRVTVTGESAFTGLALDQELLVHLLMTARADERWGAALAVAAAGGAAWLISARGGGAVGAALALTAPLLAGAAAASKNDAWFAWAALAAVLALERALARGGGVPWLLAAGCLAGASYTAKNFGALVVAGLAAALLADARARRRPAAWAALLLPPAVVALPYVVRNALALGAPVYPFLLRWWPPVGWTEGKLAMMGVVFGARTFPVTAPVEMLAAPVHALAHVSPALLALAPLAALRRGIRAAARVPLSFAAAYLAAWMAMPAAGQVRFLLPVLLVLLPPAVDAARDAAGRRGLAGPLARLILAASLAAHVAATLASDAWRAAPLGAALGRESARAFRARVAPVWTEAIAALEAEPGLAGAAVATIGQGTRHPAPRAVALWGREIEHAPVVWDLVRASQDAAQLGRKLRQRRAAGVLYNVAAASFWGRYAEAFPWAPRDVAVWRDLWLARAALRFASSAWNPDEGVLVLYELGPPRPGRRSSLWLPGTEAIFSPVRTAVYAGEPPAEVLARLDRYAGAFDGILSFDARRAALLLEDGRAAEAARVLRDLGARLAPADRARCRFFGVPELPAGPGFAAGLARLCPPGALRRERVLQFRFNLGLPCALPAAPEPTAGPAAARRPHGSVTPAAAPPSVLR